MKSTDDQKLSLPVLTAMVVGSMVGAGIYSLPRNFALEAGPKAAVISWCIAGGGMYMLARVFQLLAEIRPDLDSGIFAYARDGFGGYAGFLSAFGYWMAGCFGNVSYWVLIKSTLGAFIPAFGNGNTPIAIAISSVGIWSFHWMLLRGIQQATLINAILTVVKILPIFAFIGILSVHASAEPFTLNLAESTRGLAPQVKGTMLVTVFVFLGIEGASVYSRYAKKRSDVGAATILGFAFVLLLLVLVTLLPYALLMREEIAAMRQPSMASVLGALLGAPGAAFIGGALIVSVLGAYLAWSLICAEVLYASARSEAMPAIFARRNARQLPTAAIWLTSSVVQAFVISTYWSTDAFALMLRLTSAMALIPYFLVALFGLKAIRALPASAISSRKRLAHYATASVATIYTVFLLYACGVELLVLSALLYGPGSVLYMWARRERGQAFFRAPEWCAFLVVIGAGLFAIFELSTSAWR